MKRVAAIADRFSETATTEDGRALYFNRSLWAWLDLETGERVELASITWIDLED